LKKNVSHRPRVRSKREEEGRKLRSGKGIKVHTNEKKREKREKISTPDPSRKLDRTHTITGGNLIRNAISSRGRMGDDKVSGRKREGYSTGLITLSLPQ